MIRRSDIQSLIFFTRNLQVLIRERLLNFGGIYMLLKVLFHLFMTCLTSGLWLIGLIIWYILTSKK